MFQSINHTRIGVENSASQDCMLLGQFGLAIIIQQYQWEVKYKLWNISSCATCCSGISNEIL